MRDQWVELFLRGFKRAFCGLDAWNLGWCLGLGV